MTIIYVNAEVTRIKTVKIFLNVGIIKLNYIIFFYIFFVPRHLI